MIPKTDKRYTKIFQAYAKILKIGSVPEKLIKTFLFDYTLEDGNRFLSRLSLTQLAPEECKGWVGSSLT